MSEARPFLAFLKSPTRSLQSSLPTVAVTEAPSLWSPLADPSSHEPAIATVVASELAAEPATEPQSPFARHPIDNDAVRAEAAELGRADGLRETAALRAKLAAAVAALDVARRAIAGPSADLIAEAAVAVVAAWASSADHRELFAPIIQRWVARDHGPAVVRVHPDDVDAMSAAIGDAALTLQADDSIEPGDVEIASNSFELSHRWEARLLELRETIATLLGAL